MKHFSFYICYIEPPSIVVEPPPEIQLKVGDDLLVRCEAVGKTPMFYQWFKERQPLKDETNKELYLTKVDPMNEGLYICRVANVRGFQFSRWIRVVVGKEGEAESVDLKKPPGDETVETTNRPVFDQRETHREEDRDRITESGKVLSSQKGSNLGDERMGKSQMLSVFRLLSIGTTMCYCSSTISDLILW